VRHSYKPYELKVLSIGNTARATAPYTAPRAGRTATAPGQHRRSADYQHQPGPPAPRPW